MGLQLKICGMGTPENILEMEKLRPDYLGFIFHQNSPRNFEGKIPEISEKIKRTGVFVNATIEFVLEKVKEYQFKAVQLHGEESPEFCSDLKSQLQKENKSVEIIKVFSVGGEEFNFQELKTYEGTVDYFLFDTRGKNKGGNGILFNWEVLYDYPLKTPYFLSGGIGLEEAAKIREFRKKLKDQQKLHLLYAIDVNSKFEDAPGQKNSEKLKAFKENIQ